MNEREILEQRARVLARPRTEALTDRQGLAVFERAGTSAVLLAVQNTKRAGSIERITPCLE